MKVDVTKRQKQLLKAIYDSFSTTGYPPNFDEMREKLDVASNQGVLDLLRSLEKKQLIQREPRLARSITILPLGYEVLGQKPIIPFIGVTRAGSMAESVEIHAEWREISPSLSKLENVFILKVSGDSMINAAINDGDLVLVKSDKEFSSNDIVLAQCNGESTIKRFISQDTPPYVYLKPENPAYPLIPFTDNIELTGKVIAILNNHGEWRKIK